MGGGESSTRASKIDTKTLETKVASMFNMGSKEQAVFLFISSSLTLNMHSKVFHTFLNYFFYF